MPAIVCGGRMLEAKYLCTYDLLSSIPTLDGHLTVTQEIFQWCEIIKTGSKARLVRDGRRIVAPDFGLGERHTLAIEKLILDPICTQRIKPGKAAPPSWRVAHVGWLLQASQTPKTSKQWRPLFLYPLDLFQFTSSIRHPQEA